MDCSGVTNCLKCHYDGGVKCDKCAVGHWLGTDLLSCTSAACATGVKYVTTETSNLKCLVSCNEKG